jgi:hypothetical protein
VSRFFTKCPGFYEKKWKYPFLEKEYGNPKIGMLADKNISPGRRVTVD